MTAILSRAALSCALGGAIILAGCGGGSPSSTSTVSPAAAPGAPPANTARATGGAAPLAGEAQSAATGDIPDSQVFLTFHDAQAGYTIQYPEGWAQRGSGRDVTFQDKNNIIHVVIGAGGPPTPASVTAQLTRTAASGSSLVVGPPSTVTIAGAAAVKVSYSTLSPPNPVTGKRVQLLVDRYVTSRGGRVATLDLGTPKGVDNIDAYRKISRSFQWR